MSFIENNVPFARSLWATVNLAVAVEKLLSHNEAH